MENKMEKETEQVVQTEEVAVVDSQDKNEDQSYKELGLDPYYESVSEFLVNLA